MPWKIMNEQAALVAGQLQELFSLVSSLPAARTKHDMEIHESKTKLMANSSYRFTREMKIDDEKLETVDSFTFLGSIVSSKGFKSDICARTAQTTSAMTKLRLLWNDRNAMCTLISKINLMRSLVISIRLYGCETWTVTAKLQNWINTLKWGCSGEFSVSSSGSRKKRWSHSKDMTKYQSSWPTHNDSEKGEAQILWSCNSQRWPHKDNNSRNSQGTQEERNAEETTAGRRQRMDWRTTAAHTRYSWGPFSLEECDKKMWCDSDGSMLWWKLWEVNNMAYNTHVVNFVHVCCRCSTVRE